MKGLIRTGRYQVHEFGAHSNMRGPTLTLIACCSPTNDLYQALSRAASPASITRVDDCRTALAENPDSGFLILHDGVGPSVTIDQALLNHLREHPASRIFIEHASIAVGLLPVVSLSIRRCPPYARLVTMPSGDP